MGNSETAKNIVRNLLGKEAAIDKEIPAGTSNTDLFGNEALPESGGSEISDQDLFGAPMKQDALDRDKSVLPPDVTNSETSSGDTPDTDTINQGYSVNGDKADDTYAGKGDGPKI